MLMLPFLIVYLGIKDGLSLKAHYFISEQYWTSNYELVKEMMSQAEIQ